MRRALELLCIAVLVIMVHSCEKESSDSIIGTWVSVNKADTMFIINNHVIQKSLHSGILHTFEYSLLKDSIIIQYKGPNKILVIASSHYYELNGRKLMIDFSNSCYGFNAERETFLKNEIMTDHVTPAPR